MKDDLISRRKAINATWFEPSYTDPLNVLTEVRDRLEALPAAQPEIVRCGECKWWEKQEDSTLGYCNAAKHCYYSLNWEVQIYRRHRADFFCADGERRSENDTHIQV